MTATLDAMLQPMAFIPVGDPQSMLTTATEVSPVQDLVAWKMEFSMWKKKKKPLEKKT